MDIAAAILGVVGFFGVLIFCCSEKDGMREVIGAIISTLLLLISITMIHESGYRQGQIDSLNGEIKYELTTKPNGEVKWTVIEKEVE